MELVRISFGLSQQPPIINNKNMKTTLLSLATLMGASFAASAAVIQLDLAGVGGSGLLSTNEVPPATGGTPGSGGEIGSGIFYDDVSLILTINVGWGSGNGFTDLTGDATFAHIHGNAAQTGTAGVLFNMSSGLTASASNGSISYSTLALSAQQESDLLAGLWYVNVHTDANPGGEIRGNIVPEPSALLLGAVSLVGLLRRRRA